MESAVESSVACPLVVGSVSVRLTSSAPANPHGDEEVAATPSHKWCVYIRSPLQQNKENSLPKDLSFIEKVVFALHPSFPRPTRVVTSPPFEVIESGWGEFVIGVQVQ